jgi:hypothetical protein
MLCKYNTSPRKQDALEITADHFHIWRFAHIVDFMPCIHIDVYTLYGVYLAAQRAKSQETVRLFPDDNMSTIYPSRSYDAGS